MATQTLTLKTFSVTEANEVVLTMKGRKTLVPEGVDAKTVKGSVVATIASDASGPLFAIGELVKLDDTVRVDEAYTDFYAWFKDNFVLASNGGGVVTEAAEAEVADEDDEVIIAAGFDLDAWIADPTFATWDDAKAELSSMTAAAVKKAAKAMGVTPATSKVKTLAAIEASLEVEEEVAVAVEEVVSTETSTTSYATDLKSAKSAKAWALTADEDSLKAALIFEQNIKNRKTVIKALTDAVAALIKAAEETEVEEVEVIEVVEDSKTTKKTKAKRDDLSDEAKAEAGEILTALQGPIQTLGKLVGSKRAATYLRRLLTKENVDIAQLFERRRTAGPGRAPIGHVVGQSYTVTKNHRGDKGTCVYTIICTDSGGYQLVTVTGNREDLTDGTTYANGLALIQALSGRMTGIPTVARWFGVV